MVFAIITLIILIIINGFFSASELAMVNLNDNKVKRMAENGNKKAIKLYSLISKPSLFLSTIQIGITLAGFLSSAFAADFFADPLAQSLYKLGLPLHLEVLNTISVVFITVLLSYFTLVFGELVPKQLALQKAESISKFAVGPISFIAKIGKPLVAFLTLSTNTVVRLFGIDPNAKNEEATEEDIRMLVDVGGEKGTINHEEKTMINNIFEFNDKVVSDIITHRTEISAFSINSGLDEILKRVSEEGYTRFPVFEGDIDNIVGILHVKDLFQFIKQDNSRFHLKQVIRKPKFALEYQTIDVLFASMKQDHNHIVIVIDEYGGTEGLITIEDVIEEIVGDILSESNGPIELEIQKIAHDQYMIEGTLRLIELEDLIHVDLPTDAFDTVSGFLVNEIGYIPSEEESPPPIHYKDLTFEVKRVGDNRIKDVLLTIDNDSK